MSQDQNPHCRYSAPPGSSH
uniref:Uncharacterized protein n=1 Tax=Timema douglasi TaxID=61478 RepID=A0A7R8ZDN1_TIMDO|nr:unnamed protein product [Timema douglasi]